MVKFSTKIDPEVLEELRAFARAQDRTLASVVNEAAKTYLERERVRPAFVAAADEILAEHSELLQRLAR